MGAEPLDSRNKDLFTKKKGNTKDSSWLEKAVKNVGFSSQNEANDSKNLECNKKLGLRHRLLSNSRYDGGEQKSICK